MDFTVGAGLLLTAGALGITHGIEPDHVAGITAITHETGSPRLSALVGACFAAGHAILVVLWIALAYVLFGTTSFPPAFEQFGLLMVGCILALLSLYLGVTGVRKLVHGHEHDHGDGTHAHYHIHLPIAIRPGTDSHGEHRHKHSAFEYLKIGTIGALFTLSPPVSMIAFISITVSNSNDALLAGVVVVYTVTIVLTMAAIGGGAGSLFRLSKVKGERVHTISQVVASVVILAFAANLLVVALPALLAA